MELKRLPLTGAAAPVALNVTRTGMPAPDSVFDVGSLAPTPGAKAYVVLHTTEIDTYETNPAANAVAALVRQKGPLTKAAVDTALKKQAPAGDSFQGAARKAAKLSTGNAPAEVFGDLADLIASLAADDKMIDHQPAISVAATSSRVKEEKRNVRVMAFLYAASREADNDFHLIIGRDPAATPEQYMTMEVSGLPAKSSSAFQKLKTSRDSFQAFFGAQLPQMTYDFYQPPIPVVIEGSLFFDMSHSSGQRPGPPSLKSRMPTIWEVHPVTSIILGP